jgi:hypothetical protein
MCLGRPLILPAISDSASFFSSVVDRRLDEAGPLFAASRQGGPDLAIDVRLQLAQREVLELPLELEDAEAVGQRRVDLERLAGDVAALLVGAGCAGLACRADAAPARR